MTKERNTEKINENSISMHQSQDFLLEPVKTSKSQKSKKEKLDSNDSDHLELSYIKKDDENRTQADTRRGSHISPVTSGQNQLKHLSQEKMVLNKNRFQAKLQELNHHIEVKGDNLTSNAVPEKIVSFYGYNYNYQSDTDDEGKYTTQANKRFYKLNRAQKEARVIALWRSAHIKALVCGVFINQFHAIHTKVSYFGRQMIGQDIAKERRLKLQNKFNNPKFFCLISPTSFFKRFWDFGMMLLILYTIAYAPYRTAFMKPTSSDALFYFETLSDFLMLVDIFISFLTPYERMDGSLECNFRKISRHYIYSDLFSDLVAIFPTQFFEGALTYASNYFSEYEVNQMLKNFALLRLLRVLKILKIGKYNALIFKVISSLNFKATETRIIVIVMGAMMLVHIFACSFYIIARARDFGHDTWVWNTGNIDTSQLQIYSKCLYWAFQTLTTVGYGDFGCYNGTEILLTCVWMFVGVAFYSFVVGSLTSAITSVQSQQENLISKLKALEEFAEETKLDNNLHEQVKNFLKNNYQELFSKVDEEQMISELPPTLKEELFFHQFGSLIESLNFLQDLENDCTWGIVKNLKKIRFEKGDKIYQDKELSETMFLIHKGTVKLYAENGYPFIQFKNGQHFGDVDLFCGIRRNGTAQTTEECLLYKIQKNQLEDALQDFPALKKKLIAKALADNTTLTQLRLDVLKKNPIYGLKSRQQDALLNIKELSTKIKEKQEEFMQTEELNNTTQVDEPADADLIDQEKQINPLDDEEMNEQTQNLKRLNMKERELSDLTSDFTKKVSSIVHDDVNGKLKRTSLDFEFQKTKSLQPDGKIRFKESKKINNVKMQFAEMNTIPEMSDVTKKAKGVLSESIVELKSLKETAIKKVAYFNKVKEQQEVVRANPQLGDEAAEDSLEALVSFNEDMKTLALNAYQMQDLLDCALEENDLILEWMQNLENSTVEAESEIVKMAQAIDIMAGQLIAKRSKQ